MPPGTVLCREGSRARDRHRHDIFVITDRAFNSVLATDPTLERKALRALARRVLASSGDPTLR